MRTFVVEKLTKNYNSVRRLRIVCVPRVCVDRLTGVRVNADLCVSACVCEGSNPPSQDGGLSFSNFKTFLYLFLFDIDFRNNFKKIPEAFTILSRKIK